MNEDTHVQDVRGRLAGELEAEILSILWDAGSTPITPSEVSSRLSTNLAYTTVTTVLVRLWEKGLAVREHKGRGFAYSATLTEGEFVSRRMTDALGRARDRRSTLAHFVGTLSDLESDQLRTLLDDAEDT